MIMVSNVSEDKNVINLTIQNKDDFYDKFNTYRLSKELGDYIYNNSLQFSLKDSLVIRVITTFQLEKKEREVIVDMIREYFGLSIRETLNYYKFNRVKKLILFVLGILLIFGAHFTQLLNNFIFSEVLLIIGWVAIWEVVENILLVETKKRFRLKYLQKLVKTKILFR